MYIVDQKLIVNVVIMDAFYAKWFTFGTGKLEKNKGKPVAWCNLCFTEIAYVQSRQLSY